MKFTLKRFKSSSGIPFFPLEEKKNLRVVSLLGFIVSFFTTTFSQAEDMGIFLSVSGLVSKGYGLYSQVFEIKDPLFHYSNAIAITILGIIGPFLLDFVLSATAFPLAYLIGKNLTNSTQTSFIAAFLFQISLTGQFGQTLRSQILGILFILLSLYCALLGRWYIAGLLAAAVLFAKMPLFLISACVMIPLVLHARKLRVLLHLILGFVTFTLIIASVLFVRGEFISYLNMVRENFSYASSYQSIVGQNVGILGHYQVWNGSESRFVSFFVSNIVIVILGFKGRLLSSRFFHVVISLNIGVASFLLMTAMWPHHLQIMALYIFTNSLFILFYLQKDFFKDAPSPKPSTRNKSQFSFELRRAAAPLFVLIMLVSNSGASLPAKPDMSFNNWLHPNWTVPSEIQMLEAVSTTQPLPFSFARLGMNDDMGFGVFLEPQWKLVCKRLGIGGFEPLVEIDLFLDCLKNKADVILIAPFYESQSGRIGIYQYFFRESKEILLTRFVCNDFGNGFRYCMKKI